MCRFLFLCLSGPFVVRHSSRAPIFSPTNNPATMPRPPTRHGLEKKFKPWRKGKSTKNKSPGATGGSSSKSRASLKNTLRSQRRLLQKLPADGSSCDPAARAGIEATIAQLETEIAAKQQTQKERKNAEKYHQVRFFDRQRLVRLERTVRRSLDEAAAAADAEEEAARLRAELDDIVRDKLYVAFFPNDTKYFSLFRGGERVVDDAPTAEKRQMIRNRIAQEYHGGRLTSKSWFNLDEIKEMKSPLAAKSSAGSDPSAGKRKRAADASTKSTNKAVKKVASGKKEEDDRDGVVARNVKASKEGGNKGNDSSDGDDSSSSSSSSSGDDDSDSEQHKTKVIAKPTAKDDVEEIGDSDSSSSSSSSSSDSSDSDSSSSSDSDSSSDSSSDDSEDEGENSNKKTLKAEPQPKMPAAANEESDDDFFADDGDGKDVFEKAAQYSTGYEYEEAKGDKSRGWTTQKQRPGQWKKNRNKRY